MADDYDPYKHRAPLKPTTNFETFIHFLKGCIGTGILSMPLAFYNAGWVVGLIGTYVLGIILVYCLQILIGSMYVLCQREKVPIITYRDAMKLSFEQGPPFLRCLAPASAYIVDGLLSAYHTGICCVYVVFIADSIKQVIDNYCPNFNIDVRLYMIMLLVPLTLVYCIRSLKALAPISAISICIILTGLIILLYFMLIDLPPLSERNKTQNIAQFPLFFGAVLFSVESLGVIIALEQDMEHPELYLGICGLMNISFFAVLTLYAVFAFIGFWKYGPNVAGSVTLNIPQDKVFPQIIKLLYAVAIYLSYALQGYVQMDIIWNHYIAPKLGEDHPRLLIYEISCRCFIVIITVLFGILIPNFGLFVSLVGAFCITLLGIAFPGIMQLCVLYTTSSYGFLKVHLWKNLLIIIFGFVSFYIGTYTAISDIVEYYKKK